MSGNVFVVLLLSFSFLFGLTLWYFQNYAYYQKNQLSELSVKLALNEGIELVKLNNVQSINSKTSPLKFRSCFELKHDFLKSVEKYSSYADATPLRAPGWFKCFDVKSLTADLKSGFAKSYLSIANIEYGIDRVIAVYPNGTAYSWHQINECGSASFAGDALPENCPKQESD